MKPLSNKNHLAYATLLSLVTGCPLAPPQRVPDVTDAVLISAGYYIYRNRIYTLEEHRELRIIEGADADTFQILSANFAKDKNSVFYKGRTINQADAPTFAAFGETCFAKDKHRAFYCDNPIQGADTRTFAAINDNYAKDHSHVFHYYGFDDHIVPGADISTFRTFGANPGYGADRLMAYYEGQPIIGADVATFAPIAGTYLYSKDKSRIYCKSVVSDFDYSSFRSIGSGVYGTDIAGVYDLVTTCAPKEDLKIPGADPNTFEEILIDQEIFYAKDKNYVYINGRASKVMDPKTVRVLNIEFAIDKNGVYRLGKLMEEVDPRTFTP